ncbi:MAG: cytochrome P450, partial [Xenococcaceae cyanobacterium]
MTTPIQNPTKTATKLPDGPKTPPLLQIVQGIFSPIETLEAARDRYGDMFTIRSLGFPPAIVLSHPQAIQEVFTADPNLFDTATSNWILRPLLGENSLSQLDGLPHQRQRRLLMPPFHGERMRAYGQLICDLTKQVIGQWEIGKPFSIRSSTQEISLGVILRAVFGLDEGERYEQLRKLLSSLLDSFNSPWRSSLLFLRFLQRDLEPWSPWGCFLRQKQRIDALLTAEINQRRTQPPGEDILSLMMSARDESGQPMGEAELRDELMTLLFAGHETTASALAWAFYWTHHLPEVREKLLEELDTLSPDADPSAIAKLPYLG